MAIGGQRMNAPGFCIYRKGAQSLDGINQVDTAVPPANLTNGREWRSVSSEKLHEADGQQAGTAAGIVYAVKAVMNRKPGDGDSALLQFLPGEIIGRKLFPKCHHAIARSPVQPRGYGRDSLRCVLHQCDFGAVRPDQSGGGDAERFIFRHPSIVVQAAEFGAIVYQCLHRIRGGFCKRRYRSVVQVNQPLSYWELVDVLLPKRY